MDKKNSVAVLTNPATKRVEYLPLDEVKMQLEDNETFTLRWFYNRIVELKDQVDKLETKISEMQEAQTKINNLLATSIALANEKVSVVETDIDLLKNVK